MAVILYPVLNWGLGHASRSTEVIQKLLDKGHQVIPASDGNARAYLQKQFPQLHIPLLPALTIRYPYDNAILNTARQSISILRSFGKDTKAISRLSREVKADIIISDHRLGAYVKGLYNILLIHQINIPLSFLFSSPAHLITRFYLSKYQEIWIPDYPQRFLSGKLSTLGSEKGRFVGPLSHFNILQQPLPRPSYKQDVLVILSGPEPQRSIFEKLVLRQLQQMDLDAVIVCGQPQKEEDSSSEATKRIRKIPFLPPAELLQYIQSSKHVIARSGYSTIMDLICIRRGALLIPTPGQPEQNYLADHLAKKNNGFVFQKQHELNFRKGLKQLDEKASLVHTGRYNHPKNTNLYLEQALQALFSD